ncbi:MBL fold metallo-hydrolase [Natronorarus salvus]|uniref:MBL fold metallo-hydrolase n=1 Tax=Natronorarus salvus TaxID=3117733 RepID=UPI002F264F6B
MASRVKEETNDFESPYRITAESPEKGLAGGYVRKIEDGVYWLSIAQGFDILQQYFEEQMEMRQEVPDWYDPDKDIMITVNAWLVIGDEKTLLFDSLPPNFTDTILEMLDVTLGDRELDYLAVSHPDVPHAGNTVPVLRKYPNAKLIAPDVGDNHELYHLENSMKVGDGDEIDLGGRIVKFHDAKFVDAPMSIWMSEEKTDCLFTVDWHGFFHTREELGKFVDELEVEYGEDLDVSRFTETEARAHYWMAWADPEKLKDEIDYIIKKHEPSIVGPSHGLVMKNDPIKYLEMEKEVVDSINQKGGTWGYV